MHWRRNRGLAASATAGVRLTARPSGNGYQRHSMGPWGLEKGLYCYCYYLVPLVPLLFQVPDRNYFTSCTAINYFLCKLYLFVNIGYQKMCISQNV